MSVASSVLAACILLIAIRACEMTSQSHEMPVTIANALVTEEHNRTELYPELDPSGKSETEVTGVASKRESREDGSSDTEESSIGCSDDEFPMHATDEVDISDYVVDLDGRKYLDISAIDETFFNVTIEMVLQLEGITAVKGSECKLEVLDVAMHLRISQNITKCSTLKTLIMSGGEWPCRDAWLWLEKLTESINIDHSRANCSDLSIREIKGSEVAKDKQAIPFGKGVEMHRKLVLDPCPSICRCKTRLNEQYSIRGHIVNCDYQHLTDEQLFELKLPKQTTYFSVSNNQLTSIHKILDFLKNLGLEFLHLDYNHLSEFPSLQNDSFPKLQRIGYKGNVIKKIDPESFESLMKREILDIDFDIRMIDVKCDCKTHSFLKILLEYWAKLAPVLHIPPRCKSSTGTGETELMSLRTECEPQVYKAINPLPLVIAVLAILNAFFIFLLCDLIVVQYCSEGTSRDPVIHVILEKIKRSLAYLFSSNGHTRLEEAEEQDSVERNSYRERPVSTTRDFREIDEEEEETVEGRDPQRERVHLDVPRLRRPHTGSFSSRVSFSRRSDEVITPARL